MITWTVDVSGAQPGTLWYSFSQNYWGGDIQIIRDFGPLNTLVWTASQNEGPYAIHVNVRNLSTGDTASADAYFQMQSLVTGNQPVITPTVHPLVFLYSAPACPVGQRMRVQFAQSVQPAGTTEGMRGASEVTRRRRVPSAPQGPLVQFTSYKNCLAGLSMNFYLGGMLAQAQYTAQGYIDTGSAIEALGAPVTFTTGTAPADLSTETVLQAPAISSPEQVLLQSTIFSSTVATDLSGNLLWYYPGNLTYLTYPDQGGYFFGILEDTTGDQSYQVVREFDLTGMTVLETNAARLSEQVVAMGLPPISNLHHEARRLPDGKIVILAGVEQMLTNVQGPGTVDVLGDMILVLNNSLQVVWAWNSFDHLDVTRLATLGDQCVPNTGDCAPIYLATSANDWTHGNSVEQTPDGNLLYSARSQDWAIKIDYQNGTGSGNVIWRLGKDGDFTWNSSDPYPWFSHQHNPQFLSDNTTLTVFDDGNLRYATDPTAHSRGQVLLIDQTKFVVNFVLNADLGQYSFALGSAQKLADGDYEFDNGYFLTNGQSQTTEVNASGQTVYGLAGSAPEYRTFRQVDLYTPYNPLLF